jgi:hypothetical protein
VGWGPCVEMRWERQHVVGVETEGLEPILEAGGALTAFEGSGQHSRGKMVPAAECREGLFSICNSAVAKAPERPWNSHLTGC